MKLYFTVILILNFVTAAGKRMVFKNGKWRNTGAIIVYLRTSPWVFQM